MSVKIGKEDWGGGSGLLREMLMRVVKLSGWGEVRRVVSQVGLLRMGGREDIFGERVGGWVFGVGFDVG